MEDMMGGRGLAGRLLMSPGFAAASQAGQNLTSMRRGQPAAMTPVQAYQQQIANRAAVAQQIQAAELEKIRQQQLQQNMNPFYEYEEAKRRGHIPEDTTWAQFESMKYRPVGPTSVIQNFERWEQLNPQKEGETDEEYQVRQQEAYAELARASQMLQMGGGGIMPYNRLGGGAAGPVVTPEAATGRDARLAGARTGAEESAKTAEEQVRAGIDQAWSARTAYADASSLLEQSRRFAEMLEDGTVDTGPITALMYNWFGVGSEELGALDNEAIMQALKNLGITNLAPVTEQEFANVLRLWIDISRQEAPNLGSVRQAIQRTERLQQRIQGEARAASQRVRTYGGDREFDMLRESNPFIQELYPQAPAQDNSGWSIKPKGG